MFVSEDVLLKERVFSSNEVISVAGISSTKWPTESVSVETRNDEFIITSTLHPFTGAIDTLLLVVL